MSVKRSPVNVMLSRFAKVNQTDTIDTQRRGIAHLDNTIIDKPQKITFSKALSRCGKFNETDLTRRFVADIMPYSYKNGVDSCELQKVTNFLSDFADEIYLLTHTDRVK